MKRLVQGKEEQKTQEMEDLVSQEEEEGEEEFSEEDSDESEVEINN